MAATPPKVGRQHVLLAGISMLALTVLLFGATSAMADLPPDPIVPEHGEITLLDTINSIPLNDIKTALDHYPVPYVVVCQAGSGPPVSANQRAGSPTRVDCDSSKTTGKGGSDLQVEVNTELGPPEHLRLNINRLGVAPFATNVKVLIAFPWDAFNAELGLPAAPNLFIGYQTTTAGGGVGGIAPLSEEIRFTPNVVAGTTHTFQTTMLTTGASNPLRFQAGHFDGTNLTGILNAAAYSALVEPVPASINLGLGVSESILSPGPGGIDSSIDLTWDATAPSKVTFDYLEEEGAPGGVADYQTTLTVDQMPTHEHLSVDLDEAAGTLALNHTASAPINAVTLTRTRNDGLTIVGTAGDVPTSVALTVGLSGTATLDVNANTLDLSLKATEAGGFLNTSGFLGYNVGYVEAKVLNAPDLTAAYLPADDKFTVQATNPGESIGAVQLVIGDDGVLELAPAWSFDNRHLFSLIDDGTHGTAAARAVHLTAATLDLEPSPTGEILDFRTGQAAGMNAYIETKPGSNLIPGHDILADCHIFDVPLGHTHVTIELPKKFGYTTDPLQGIADLGCAGHIDSLNFDVALADLPPIFEFDFEPNDHLTVKAEDGSGPNSAFVGLAKVRFWDSTGPGLPASSAVFGTPLRDARARADHIPSFHGTWATGGGGTTIDYHNDSAANFLGGVQVDVSNEVGLAELPVASASAHDYARYVDHGAGATKELAAGAFGIRSFTYASNDAARTLDVHYRANEAHQLDATFDSRFGGTFFPAYDVDATLTVNSVPASFDLSTDLATNFDYTASSGITSIGLLGDIDITNDGNPGNSTHVDASVNGLPAAAALDVTPAATGSATFTMSSAIDSINLDLTGAEGVFGNAIKQVHLAIDHIPANWAADWDPTGGNVTAVGDHVDEISLIVSKELPASNDAMRAPFLAPGGAISYTPWLRAIDRRWARTGAGDPDVRETHFMSRLDDIYTSTTSLAPSEDRVLYIPSGGSLKYLEVQLTNLQGGSFHSTSTTANASFTDPVTGDHPVFVGIGQQNGDFLTIGLENLPDQIDIDAVAQNPGHVHFDSNEPAKRVALYQGPLPSAGEGDATKFIVVSVPASMHLDWNFGVNGNASFTASSEVEIRLLRQNGSTRIVSAFNFQNLNLSYGVESGEVSSDECLPLPPFTCNEYVVVVEGSASFTASPGINGMLLVYDHGSTEDANGISSPGSTYRPELSFLLKNLTSISASAGIRVCFLPLGVPGPWCVPGVPIPFFGFGVSADAANVDFWDNGGGPLDILGDPDYVSNDPWNLYPLLYSESNRIDPFS
jgi:hypothetical protein